MREHSLPPNARSLSQSMRDLGYSLETAIADIVDNSITAKASSIHIHFDKDNSGEPSLAFVDNGSGMSEKVLIEAMRHGSRNPREQRDKNDLGRFGLGLKTASFSQCKRLTVATLQNNEYSAAVWDLDFLYKNDNWTIQLLDEKEIHALPYIGDLKEHGTLVLWQKLDRLFEGETSINDKLAEAEKHLSLVFHLYLSGEVTKPKTNIFINGHKIEPFDPFCLSSKATQILQAETVNIDGEEVKIQPYILPHHSKLPKKTFDYYKSRGDFVSNQGAYVYRNGRLMAHGDWFRLCPKSEATKLARVRIDFPNSLDERWTIDIKKSRAYPPFQVRERLRQIISKVINAGTLVHKGRGKKIFEKTFPFWDRHPERDGIRYTINRAHPMISALETSLSDESRKTRRRLRKFLFRSSFLSSMRKRVRKSSQKFLNMRTRRTRSA